MTVISKRPREPAETCEAIRRIADRESAVLGRKATPDEVARAAMAEGHSETAARGAYAGWSRAFDRRPPPGGTADAAAASPAAPPPDPGVRLTVADNGRIVIPKDMREAMELGPDGAVTARLVDGELRLISPRAAVRRIQSRMAKYKTPGTSVVDEFLAERRAMWSEE